MKTLDQRLEWLSVNGIKLRQFYPQFSAFFEIAKALSPLSTVIEVGGSFGGSFYLFGGLSDSPMQMINVDLCKPRRQAQCLVKVCEALKCQGHDVHLIRGDSQKPEVISQVRAALSGREADLVFIDADHSYEGVKTDFQNYGQMVREGGIIAFHDVCPGGGGEVNRFWQELENSSETFTFRAEKVSIRCYNTGIGIVYKG